MTRLQLFARHHPWWMATVGAVVGISIGVGLSFSVEPELDWSEAVLPAAFILVLVYGSAWLNRRDRRRQADEQSLAADNSGT